MQGSAESIKQKLSVHRVTHCLMLSREAYKGYCFYYFLCHHIKKIDKHFFCDDTAAFAGRQGAITTILILLPTIFKTASH